MSSEEKKGKKMSQTMRKMLVTSLSGTWPKAGVKLGVGRGGDMEKCQISMAWEQPVEGLESGAYGGKQLQPQGSAGKDLGSVWERLAPMKP